MNVIKDLAFGTELDRQTAEIKACWAAYPGYNELLAQQTAEEITAFRATLRENAIFGKPQRRSTVSRHSLRVRHRSANQPVVTFYPGTAAKRFFRWMGTQCAVA